VDRVQCIGIGFVAKGSGAVSSFVATGEAFVRGTTPADELRAAADNRDFILWSPEIRQTGRHDGQGEFCCVHVTPKALKQLGYSLQDGEEVLVCGLVSVRYANL
jgi:hypothetical protein